MKKENLADLIGEDIGCWEIIAAEYNKNEKAVKLILNEFIWRGVFHGRDYKEYLNNIKQIKILDKYCFKYLDEDKKINSMEELIINIGGLNVVILKRIFDNATIFDLSAVQSVWKKVMLKNGYLDESEYKKAFLSKLKEEIIEYYKTNNFSDIKELVEFIEDVYLDVEGINK